MAAPIDDVTWRALVESRVIQLRADLTRVAARSDRDWTEHPEYRFAQQRIEAAHAKAATAPVLLSWTWVLRWASGTDVETAWRAIHDAEQSLVMLLPDEILGARLPELRAALATTLGEDGRFKDYDRRLDEYARRNGGAAGPPEFGGDVRAHIKVIKSAIDSTSDDAHSNIRNYRNWLLIVSTAVTLVTVGAAIAHAFSPHFLHICQASATNAVSCSGPGADVGQIEAAGAVGGLLVALFALIRLKVFSGAVALPLWLALVRVPAGAAAGLVGALIVQGHVVGSISPQTRSGLLAYAVLFGAAPEFLLRLIDRKVNEATGAARTKNDPLTTVPPQS